MLQFVPSVSPTDQETLITIASFKRSTVVFIIPIDSEKGEKRMIDFPSQFYNLTTTDAIRWYLQDLTKISPLSLKAEQEVVQRIIADPLSQEANDARDLLIKANLRFVVRLALRYAPFGVELPDLIQEGNLTLIKAVRKFNPRRCSHFRQYARLRVNWFLYHMVEAHLAERYLMEPNCEAIRPLSAQVLKALARNAIDEQALVFDLPENRFVSLEALLEESDVDSCHTNDCFSAHASYSDETLGEYALQQERMRRIAECLQSLTLREQFVLTQRYLRHFSLSREAVGKKLCITYERVRQLEERGLRKLRHPRSSKILRSLF